MNILLSMDILLLFPVSSRLVPKPLSLEPSKAGKQLATRPQRDLELPMSPIGKPSTLEIMDTSAVHSERFDRIRGDASWSGGRTEELPRVSTQKIPHRTLLDSFGPPKIRVSPERSARTVDVSVSVCVRCVGLMRYCM